MVLKNNRLFDLPRFASGSFGDLDRLKVPNDILMLKKVSYQKDKGDIQLICRAKDGPEQVRGRIRFAVDDGEKKDELFCWLRLQIGKDIETIYGSSFSFKGEK